MYCVDACCEWSLCAILALLFCLLSVSFFFCRAFPPSHVSSLECIFSLLHPDSLLEFFGLLLVLSSRLLSSQCFDSAGIYRGSCPIWWCPELRAGSGSMVRPVPCLYELNHLSRLLAHLGTMDYRIPRVKN